MTNITNLIRAMSFLPKENASRVYQKRYPIAGGYAIEIDCAKREIHYGDKITIDNKGAQNFLKAENWVVLECVNRLLEKGYQPQNITLEKTWKTGHGTSGRLDILVSKDDGTAYLMIECKTWGAEYQKELKNIEKNGGQLFTYFQQDKNAEILMLYTSKLDGKDIEFHNSIIKVEEDYRQTGNVEDLFDRWNQLYKYNGVFESGIEPYGFRSEALKRRDLKAIQQEDSSFIFHSFLKILRHNVVSDKPNAFNKIFNLFLCKIIDEDKSDDEQLEFQWLEGVDNHISFQKRLTDLYNKGMQNLLDKKVTDISDKEFDKRFQGVDDDARNQFKEILTEIRLKKNNEFAIKEVFDDDSFEENAKVVKEVVELLQVYKIRYNYRQQFLGDFFELLLTTGLKQESGQFFTPVPIARYIIKSLPIREITLQKIKQGNHLDLLPNIIDYAAGSGHFITEVMEVIQNYINELSEDQSLNLNQYAKRELQKWRTGQFDWADRFVYAIEKDYRLVKTAKVSCYLHGDGLAKVIHGDGLGDFATSKDFKGILKQTDGTYPQDNKQFDVVISNPPYSVSAFKGTMMDAEKAQRAFTLYSFLTDQSSEIECLFIERTKQLLKDDGVAGIILPNSILNNSGIYTLAREIILKYFDILGITEFGSGTFMATNINTVVLFLRRRNNADALNIEESVRKFFINFRDVTTNGIEDPVHKYVEHIWEGLSFEDYITLLTKKPNQAIKQHEIFREYQSKIKAKSDTEKWESILTLEQEKLLYYILAYPQKLVAVKSGEKTDEKRFLGYEFSSRRGSEGIHPTQRGKSIDECTLLYDDVAWDNSGKASTYNYAAFKGEFDLGIPEQLQQNVSYQNLVDMLSFDRVVFDKTISLTAKKKVRIESKWEVVRLNEVAEIDWGNTSLTKEIYKENGEYDVYSATGLDGKADFYEHDDNAIILSAIGARCGKCFLATGKWTAIKNTIIIRNKSSILLKYLFQYVNDEDYWDKSGTAQPFITLTTAKEQRIPLPPLDIQQSIVAEIEVFDKKEEEAKREIANFNIKITELFEKVSSKSTSTFRLSDDSVFEVFIGKRVLKEELIPDGEIPVISANVFVLFGTIDELLIEDFSKPSVLWGIDGDWMVNYVPKDCPFYPTDHCGVLRVKGKSINERYLAFALEKAGEEFGFSRTNRASIERIQGIKIPAPTLTEQEKFVSQLEKVETEKKKLEDKIAEILLQREAVLKKWLN